MTPQKTSLGSIGAGNMATALVGGVVRAGLVAPENCLACDVSEEARAWFTDATGVAAVEKAVEVLERCDTVLIAVKPFVVGSVLEAIRGAAEARHLFVSVAAGVRAKRFEDALGGQARVIRVMPNTPALVGAGAAGVAHGSHSTAEDMELALRLLRAVGQACEVSEDQIDAVTAVSGSGPAYFYYFVENLIRAGQAVGLERATAEELAKQTALGAARMMVESDDTPEALRKMVTTPGGTTQAAIETFQTGGLEGLILSAVRAAAERGRELGKE